jgi:hypothetical protein
MRQEIEEYVRARVGARRNSEACAMMILMVDENGIGSALTMERVGKVSESTRAFDVEYWQRQGSNAIFAAAWEMVVDVWRWKNKSRTRISEIC